MTKTFSLDVKTIIRLKRCHNQSATVEKAVIKFLNEREEFNLADVPLRTLLASLQGRTGDQVLDKMIEVQLSTS